MTMHRDASISAWSVRAAAALFSAFGALALLLAAIGIWVLLVAAVVLSTTAMLACYFPARRATRVAPLEALRSE